MTPTRAKRLRSALKNYRWKKKVGGFSQVVCEVTPADLAELLEIAGIDEATAKRERAEAREAKKAAAARRKASYAEVASF